MKYTKSMHKREKKAVQDLLDRLISISEKFKLTANSGKILIANISPELLVELKHIAPFNTIHYLVLTEHHAGHEDSTFSFQYNPITGAISDSTKFNKKGENTVGHIQYSVPGMWPEEELNSLQEANNLLDKADEDWKFSESSVAKRVSK